MRLGVTISHADVGDDPGFLREYAQAVEDAGFDHVLTAEHVIGGHPDRAGGEQIHTYDVPYHEPFVLLGYLGAVTTRLELVTSILILPQRQTVLVAKQAAELDLLTGGRVRLGVGVGRNWMEYEALNEEFSDRGKRIEEQIQVLRRLWTEELVTFDGRWHHLDRVGLNPMPVQRPIPIWMGSFRGRVVERVIERVGRLADGWFPQFPPGEDLAAVLDRMRGYATAAGRDPASIGVEGGIAVRRDDDPQRWVDRATAFRALGATHLRVITAGGGFETPSDHLAAALRWIDAVAPLRGRRARVDRRPR
jgi:probable F420-dependent oxidoreductase